MPYVAMPTNALVAPCKASPTCFMTPVLVPPVITQAPGVFATFGKFEYVLQWNFSKSLNIVKISVLLLELSAFMMWFFLVHFSLNYSFVPMNGSKYIILLNLWTGHHCSKISVLLLEMSALIVTLFSTFFAYINKFVPMTTLSVDLSALNHIRVHCSLYKK